jgi:membrane protease YdiL (CAAX protease family)
MIIIYIISLAAYVFVGGLLNGLTNEPDEEPAMLGLLFWPLIIIIWLGDEFGRFLRKIFKD